MFTLWSLSSPSEIMGSDGSLILDIMVSYVNLRRFLAWPKTDGNSLFDSMITTHSLYDIINLVKF